MKCEPIGGEFWFSFETTYKSKLVVADVKFSFSADGLLHIEEVMIHNDDDFTVAEKNYIKMKIKRYFSDYNLHLTVVKKEKKRKKKKVKNKRR